MSVKSGPLQVQRLPLRQSAYYLKQPPSPKYNQELFEECARRARRAVVKSLRPMHNTLTSLTKREREVLSLLANGEATNELARMLEVRPRTVQKHLQRIYAKLGVKGRTAAALMIVRSGIFLE